MPRADGNSIHVKVVVCDIASRAAHDKSQISVSTVLEEMFAAR